MHYRITLVSQKLAFLVSSYLYNIFGVSAQHIKLSAANGAKYCFCPQFESISYFQAAVIEHVIKNDEKRLYSAIAAEAVPYYEIDGCKFLPLFSTNRTKMQQVYFCCLTVVGTQ